MHRVGRYLKRRVVILMECFFVPVGTFIAGLVLLGLCRSKKVDAWVCKWVDDDK